MSCHRGVSLGSSAGSLKCMSADYHVERRLNEMPSLVTSGGDAMFPSPATCGGPTPMSQASVSLCGALAERVERDVSAVGLLFCR